jgi:S-DNA-T family DNA segregation ATPase FtsK/SpoIIIE
MLLFGRTGAIFTIVIAITLVLFLITGTTLKAFLLFLRELPGNVKNMPQNIKEWQTAKKASPQTSLSVSADRHLQSSSAQELPPHPVTASALETPQLASKKSAVQKLDSKKDAYVLQQMPPLKHRPVIDISLGPGFGPGKAADIEAAEEVPDTVPRTVRRRTVQPDDSLSELDDIIRRAVPVEKLEFEKIKPSKQTFMQNPEKKILNKKPSNQPDQKLDRKPDKVAYNKASPRIDIPIDIPFEDLSAQHVPGDVSYKRPSVDLLNEPKCKSNTEVSQEELYQNAELLVNTLQSFGVHTKIIGVSCGPTVTRYEVQPSVGVKISKITSLADDIALNLAAACVRMEAPIPNKSAVGIEIPNRNTNTVYIKELLNSPEFVNSDSNLAVALGRNISGGIVTADISKMPHLLIAGATGSGKSVCINSIIISLLYKSGPDEVRLLMIDPKVVELGVYNGIPHLLVPVVTDPRKAAGALNWAVTEMLNRYKLFAEKQVRDIKGYNRFAYNSENLEGMKPLPHIVIIIDELADLMMAAPNDVEEAICRLTQMARAAGMHLVIATQRPSVDVITGVIKANIPSRIAFAVSSQVDSRTIIDSGGAEKLLGKGDMLFSPVGSLKPYRVQGCFVGDREVEHVVNYIKSSAQADYDDVIIEEIDRQAVPDKKSSSAESSSTEGGEDEMLSRAIECVVGAGQASIALLQRRLKLGYARAARIMDMMEEKMIIGPPEGGRPRQVLVSSRKFMDVDTGGDSEKENH